MYEEEIIIVELVCLLSGREREEDPKSFRNFARKKGKTTFSHRRIFLTSLLPNRLLAYLPVRRTAELPLHPWLPKTFNLIKSALDVNTL